jgi:predicted secreted protein
VNIMTFIIVLTIFWVITVFMILPIGAKPPEKPALGHADSAPEKSYMGIKLLASFSISLVLTMVYWYVVL